MSDRGGPEALRTDAPPGAPWDLPLSEAPLAFLDLEMTGLSAQEDRIIEICIERVQGGVLVDRLHSLVHPGARRGATHVHGITDEELEQAPPFSAVASEVRRLLDGAVPIAHGVGTDLAFLEAEFARLALLDAAPKVAIDTLTLARRVLHQRTYGLAALGRALGVEGARVHRADADVATLRRLWARVVEELAPKTARDLLDVHVGIRAARAMVVATIEQAIAQAKADGSAAHVVYRRSGKSAERLTMVFTLLEAPHAIGYVLPGRGRRELRVDRILRIELAPPRCPP